jgi:hypothetical protein
MTKDLAIFGAALTLLDDVCTSVVSAATAAAYIAGQVTLPFDVAWMTVIFIVGIAIVALLGVKGSAEAMTTILICHVRSPIVRAWLSGVETEQRFCALQLITIASLAIAGVIHWATMGNGVLKENWVEGQAGSASAIAKQVFLGVCVAFLGVTGCVFARLFPLLPLTPTLPLTPPIQLRNRSRLHLVRPTWRLPKCPSQSPVHRHLHQLAAHARHFRRPAHARDSQQCERAELGRGSGGWQVVEGLGLGRRSVDFVRDDLDW